MFQFLLVVFVIVSTALTGVILMQRSEGGGLTGGSPAGLMSARGAADFLTRTTTILATLFVGVAIALAAYASISRAPKTIDTSLSRKKGAIDAAAPGVLPGAAAGAANAVVAPPVPLAPSGITAPVTTPDQTKPGVPNPVPTETKKPVVKVEPKAETPKPVVAPKPVPVIKKPVMPETAEPKRPEADGATKVPEGLIPPANPQ